MIPLKDSAPSRLFPAINILIIVANMLIFVFQQSLPSREAYHFILFFGTVPQEISTALHSFLFSGFQPVFLPALFPLISANFLHGSWLHLLGNMLYLWVFGDNIESRLGHVGYLLFYLFMGAGSQLIHILVSPFSTTPLIGASGAIAGVLGAYFILYPHSRVLTLVPLLFFVTFIRIPAVIFLALWFLLQLFNAAAAAGTAGVQQVAWWAHIGGFITGLVVGVVTKKRMSHGTDRFR